MEREIPKAIIEFLKLDAFFAILNILYNIRAYPSKNNTPAITPNSSTIIGKIKSDY